MPAENQLDVNEQLAIRLWQTAHPTIHIGTEDLPDEFEDCVYFRFRLIDTEANLNRLRIADQSLVLQGFTHAQLTHIRDGYAHVTIAQTLPNRLDKDHMIATGQIRELAHISA